MVNVLAVLAYFVTHDHGHADQLRLAVKPDGHALEVRWSRVPPETHSLAVMVTDEKKPKTHYYSVIYNLPSEARHVRLEPHVKVSRHYLGANSWGEHDYHQSQQPVKVAIYALDTRFSENAEMSGDQLASQIKGHLVAYGKSRPIRVT